MGRFYSNPRRERDKYALPDCEVFYMDAGEWWYDKKGERREPPDDGENISDGWGRCEAGWYWWTCFPGCMPDSEPMGPFDTEEEAIEDARAEAGWDDEADDLEASEDEVAS